MSGPLSPASHRVCLMIPERLASSGWVEHIPFAMWLTSVMRPRVLVELGTSHGTSYCGFCQAVAALGLPTAAFAVDTWEGDPHAGALGPEIFAELKAHHDPRYQAFSTLLQMTFDEAVGRFTDGEIDLLHIDGYHTYEAVRHDFEAWRAKLSDRGVILFHDVTERVGDFGVWRLWDELRAQYPSFTFEHEHGLGVLAVGSDLPEEVRALVELGGDEIESIRTLFHQLGNRLRLRMELDATRAERDAHFRSFQMELDATRAERDAHFRSFQSAMTSNQALSSLLQEANHRLEQEELRRIELESERERLRRVEQEIFKLRRSESQLREDVERHQREMAGLQASFSWRLTHRLAELGGLVAPLGSKRRRLIKRAVRIRELSQG